MRPDSLSTSRILCLHVVSYAFSRSNDTHNTSCLDEKADSMSEENLASESVVLLIFLKPLCSSGNSPLLSKTCTNLLLTIFSINLQTQLVRDIGL